MLLFSIEKLMKSQNSCRKINKRIPKLKKKKNKNKQGKEINT